MDGVKERGILFSAPMVHVILEGRKTQTRRAYKNRKHPDFGCGIAASELAREQQHVIDRICPFGQPGDRLWVRETWQGPLIDNLDEYRADPDGYKKPEHCVYAADGGAPPEFITLDDELVQRWRPSIHMPRWASRILLEITAVRVERLNDISEADAMAEGADCLRTENCTEKERRLLDLPLMDDHTPYRNGFALLWESLSGSGSWASNPWVWAIDFKRVAP